MRLRILYWKNIIKNYAIYDLILLVGYEQISFLPRGRNIVGFDGHVDVLGYCGESILVLLQDDWRVLLTRQPKLITQCFNESVFLEMLTFIMRPVN